MKGKIVSIKTRSQLDAYINIGTATRCSILLNLSTNIKILNFLCTLKYLAFSNARTHELILERDVEIPAHREICFQTTTMPTNRCVVILIHDMQSQITIFWYDDTRRVAGNISVL